MSGPLQGIKVLDLTRVLAGPYCTMILGDLGADVLKVELPGGSDDTRYWGPPYQEGQSAYYLCTNRNKRSLTLNLKSSEGQDIVKQLVQESDVLIHNFKNGTMEKWGLDYENLKEINESLVYCAITGFGAEGPYSHLPGYDYIIQAMSGLMSITGTEETGPLKVGVAITDIITGLYAGVAINAALQERVHSGQGQWIDLSLFDSAISALANVGSNYLVSGQNPQLLGNDHPNIVPYQTFPTSDGQMVVAVGNDRQFEKFCSLLGLEELAADEKYKTNSARVKHRKELGEILSTAMRQKTAQEWLELLGEHGIPCGPIHQLDEVFADPHVQERGMRVEVDHPTAGTVPLIGSPLRFSRNDVSFDRHPPLPGEHTEEILQELGYSAEQCKRLKDRNIV